MRTIVDGSVDECYGQKKEDNDPRGGTAAWYLGTWWNITTHTRRVLLIEQANPVHINPIGSCCNGAKKEQGGADMKMQ